MITAVDTNVLIDVFRADPEFGLGSRAAMNTCLREGTLIICEVVLAETRALFDAEPAANSALGLAGVSYVAPSASSALLAGDAWRGYRAAGGPRARMMADFLIGAHAMEQADRLLTRDRGFYRRYFSELTVLDPNAG